MSLVLVTRRRCPYGAERFEADPFRGLDRECFRGG
jgi:hypothetical protein